MLKWGEIYSIYIFCLLLTKALLCYAIIRSDRLYSNGFWKIAMNGEWSYHSPMGKYGFAGLCEVRPQKWESRERERERERPQSFHDRSGVKMVQPSPPILRPVRQRVQRGARRRLWGRERREIESGTSHSLRERHEVRIWEATKGARHKRESHPFYNIFFVYHPYFCLESSD